LINQLRLLDPAGQPVALRDYLQNYLLLIFVKFCLGAKIFTVLAPDILQF